MPGPKSDKRWSDALQRAVMRESAGKGSPKWLEVIADRVCQEAANGDMTAVKEIGERLDGKPKQTVDSNVNLDGKLELVKRIVRDGEATD